MEDLENVLMELSALEKNPQTTAISRCLDEYLTHVAKTGNALFAWNKVKPLFKRKLEMIIKDFQETSPTDTLPLQPNVEVFKFDQMKERVFEQLESYTGIPFTVQRLCELMVQPKKHYKRTDKFMRGLEKVMLVVSTVDPNPVPGEPEAECEAGASSLETESPSKRMRLSSAQDTEAGPCDSADEAGLSVAGAAVAVEVDKLLLIGLSLKTSRSRWCRTWKRTRWRGRVGSWARAGGWSGATQRPRPGRRAWT